MAEARINLPEQGRVQAERVLHRPAGREGQDAAIVEQQPGRIVFRTTKPHAGRQRADGGRGFPKGVVIEPAATQKLDAMLQDDPALRVAAIGGGLVLLYYLLAWLLVGRDPPRGTIIPLFAPPPGMSAAAVRFVEDMTFDDRVFAAAIVGLGVNGHLKLVDNGGSQELHHIKSTSRSTMPSGRSRAAVRRALRRSRSTIPTTRRSPTRGPRCINR